MSKDTSFTCLISVVGHLAHGDVYSNSSRGTGKSCLCSRLMYSGVDDYISDHPSLLALHEFESQVISTDSFIYWGPKTCSFAAAKGRDVAVKLEVVEHTLFYHDETSRPFSSMKSLLVPRSYAKKLQQAPESSRKISYFSRDAIGFPGRYTCLPYPSNVHKLHRGYLVVVDVSIGGLPFERQLTSIEFITYELSKQPMVIAATKRDIADLTSLQKLFDWATKQKLTVIETSAQDNINIKDAFRLTAAKALASKKIKINDDFLDFKDASGHLLSLRSQAKKDLKYYLKTSVHASSVTLDRMEHASEYQNALDLLGKFATDEIIASYLLQLRNTEASKYSGVDDNPDIRIEILEMYIDTMVDFIAHKGALLKLASSLANQSCADDGIYCNDSSPIHLLSPTQISPGFSAQTSPGLSAPISSSLPALISPGLPVTAPGLPALISPIHYVKFEQVDGSYTNTSIANNSGDKEMSPDDIEDVYDEFDFKDDSNQLQELPISNRAELLRKQLSGENVNVTSFIQNQSTVIDKLGSAASLQNIRANDDNNFSSTKAVASSLVKLTLPAKVNSEPLVRKTFNTSVVMDEAKPQEITSVASELEESLKQQNKVAAKKGPAVPPRRKDYEKNALKNTVNQPQRKNYEDKKLGGNNNQTTAEVMPSPPDKASPSPPPIQEKPIVKAKPSGYERRMLPNASMSEGNSGSKPYTKSRPPAYEPKLPQIRKALEEKRKNYSDTQIKVEETSQMEKNSIQPPVPSPMIPLSPKPPAPTPSQMIPLSPKPPAPAPSQMIPLSPKPPAPSPSPMIPLSPRLSPSPRGSQIPQILPSSQSVMSPPLDKVLMTVPVSQMSPSVTNRQSSSDTKSPSPPPLPPHTTESMLEADKMDSLPPPIPQRANRPSSAEVETSKQTSPKKRVGDYFKTILKKDKSEEQIRKEYEEKAKREKEKAEKARREKEEKAREKEEKAREKEEKERKEREEKDRREREEKDRREREEKDRREREEKDRREREEREALARRRHTQVNMKTRPLPVEPLVHPDHSELDYEPVDRPQMPLPPTTSQPYVDYDPGFINQNYLNQFSNLPYPPPVQNPQFTHFLDHPPPQSQYPLPPRAYHGHPQSYYPNNNNPRLPNYFNVHLSHFQMGNPRFLMDNPQFPPRPLDNSQFPPHPMDNSQFPPRPMDNPQFPPRPMDNPQFPPRPMDNPQFPPRPMDNSQFPPHPMDNRIPTNAGRFRSPTSLDNMQSLRTAPRRTQSTKVTSNYYTNEECFSMLDEDGYEQPDVIDQIRNQMKTLPRQMPKTIDYDYPEIRGIRSRGRPNLHRSLCRDDSYLSMTGDRNDSDLYINSETIQEQSSLKKLPFRSQDDMHVYYNIRTGDNITSSGISLPLPARSNDDDDDVKPPTILPPKPKPAVAPPVPPKSKLTIVTDPNVVDEETGQAQVAQVVKEKPLPPRDILRKL